MADYHLTNAAVEDLSEIWNYTFDEWSENQADKYYFLLLDSCQQLAENPKKGKSYHTIIKGLFGYRSNQHVIFYIITSSKTIEIVRVLHGRMDLKSKFL